MNWFWWALLAVDVVFRLAMSYRLAHSYEIGPAG